MNSLEVMRHRRTIRKYQEKPVCKEDLRMVLEAGTWAPSAGGGQRSIICGIRNKEICELLGKLNISRFDRSRLAGSYVSHEQPSIIDDPTIESGFYGAPCVCVVFAPKDFLYSIPDAFCCAENMVLAASELGLASCIVARAEETFDNEIGQKFMRQWDIPEGYIARCFVLLGYCEGDYPQEKPRKPKRVRMID